MIEIGPNLSGFLQIIAVVVMFWVFLGCPWPSKGRE